MSYSNNLFNRFFTYILMRQCFPSSDKILVIDNNTMNELIDGKFKLPIISDQDSDEEIMHYLQMREQAKQRYDVIETDSYSSVSESSVSSDEETTSTQDSESSDFDSESDSDDSEAGAQAGVTSINDAIESTSNIQDLLMPPIYSVRLPPLRLERELNLPPLEISHECTLLPDLSVVGIPRSPSDFSLMTPDSLPDLEPASPIELTHIDTGCESESEITLTEVSNQLVDDILKDTVKKLTYRKVARELVDDIFKTVLEKIEMEQNDKAEVEAVETVEAVEAVEAVETDRESEEPETALNEIIMPTCECKTLLDLEPVATSIVKKCRFSPESALDTDSADSVASNESDDPADYWVKLPFVEPSLLSTHTTGLIGKQVCILNDQKLPVEEGSEVFHKKYLDKDNQINDYYSKTVIFDENTTKMYTGCKLLVQPFALKGISYNSNDKGYKFISQINLSTMDHIQFQKVDIAQIEKILQMRLAKLPAKKYNYKLFIAGVFDDLHIQINYARPINCIEAKVTTSDIILELRLIKRLIIDSSSTQIIFSM